MRARHVTYYTISDGRVFPLRRPGIEPGSTEPQSVIMPLYNRRDANEQVLAGDRTLGLPRVKRAICQLSYENRDTTHRGDRTRDLSLRRGALYQTELGRPHETKRNETRSRYNTSILIGRQHLQPHGPDGRIELPSPATPFAKALWGD